MGKNDEPEQRSVLVTPTGEGAVGEMAPHVETPPSPPTPLASSQAAFRADLTELLASHPGEWAAYADGRRVRFGQSQAELYRHCLHDLGLTHDRFVVRRVVPESPQVEYNLR